MRIFLAFISILTCSVALAQQPTRAELEKKRKDILEVIKQTEDQLATTQKNTKVTMGQLRALQSKLNSRQKLINNINQEIGQIGSSINNSSSEIERLKGNLEILKMRYAQSVRYAYKSRSSYDMLAFLFSADDFNEAVRRLKYLKRYRDYRKDQAQQIRITQAKLEKEINSLNSEKAKKDILLTAQEKQKEAIVQEKEETDYMIRELKGREKELVARLQKNKKAAQQLDNAVEQIIKREMEIARKKAEEERRRREEEEKRRRAEEERQRRLASATKVENGIKVDPYSNTGPSTPVANSNTNTPVKNEPPVKSEPPKPKSNYNYALTPEANALSNNFESNKGKLPYPVAKGFISVGFGRYTHPIAEKVEMVNYGVDIRTNPGADARAVFDGVVTSVLNIPGKDWNVIINHGAYFTVYSQLSEVNVKKDQKVSTKQKIGTVSVNEEGESVINFQVWQGGNKVDPALWLAR